MVGDQFQFMTNLARVAGILELQHILLDAFQRKPFPAFIIIGYNAAVDHIFVNEGSGTPVMPGACQ